MKISPDKDDSIRKRSESVEQDVVNFDQEKDNWKDTTTRSALQIAINNVGFQSATPNELETQEGTNDNGTWWIALLGFILCLAAGGAVIVSGGGTVLVVIGTLLFICSIALCIFALIRLAERKHARKIEARPPTDEELINNVVTYFLIVLSFIVIIGLIGMILGQLWM